MFKSIAILTISFLLIFLLAETSHTQSHFQTLPCVSLGYYHPYWDSDAVFVGLAEKVSIVDKDSAVVKFRVEKQIRGAKVKAIEVETLNSRMGVFFEEGKRYFVYASRSKAGKLQSGICSLSVLLADADEDLEYAEDIAKGKPGTRIYGFIIEDRWELYRSRKPIPLGGIVVTIQNKTERFTTRTDEKGRYVFKNIPAGLYEINAELPSSLRDRREFPQEGPVINLSGRDLKSDQVYIGKDFSNVISLNKLNDRKTFYRYSDSYNFFVNTFGSIKGKFISHNNENPPQLFVWLLRLDENGKAILADPIAYLWTNPKNGEFYFDSVPEGKYVVAINRYNCHLNQNPQYSRNFYPGVFNETDAEIISVQRKQDVELGNFQLLPPLKERIVSGIVLSADKMPVVDATVNMMADVKNFPSECVTGDTIGTKTDENGNFSVKGFEGYDYRIGAYKEIENTGQPRSRMTSGFISIPTKDKVDNLEVVIK